MVYCCWFFFFYSCRFCFICWCWLLWNVYLNASLWKYVVSLWLSTSNTLGFIVKRLIFWATFACFCFRVIHWREEITSRASQSILIKHWLAFRTCLALTCALIVIRSLFRTSIALPCRFIQIWFFVFTSLTVSKFFVKLRFIERTLSACFLKIIIIRLIIWTSKTLFSRFVVISLLSWTFLTYFCFLIPNWSIKGAFIAGTENKRGLFRWAGSTGQSCRI